MSRKDYRAIAAVIRQELNETVHCTGTLRNVANELAVAFKRDNPRFSRAKFMAAAGFEGF